MYAIWLVHIRDMNSSKTLAWHGSFIYVAWLIHVCDMTYAYVWHDSFIYTTWHIHMCEMIYLYAWYDALKVIPMNNRLQQTATDCNNDTFKVIPVDNRLQRTATDCTDCNNNTFKVIPVNNGLDHLLNRREFVRLRWPLHVTWLIYMWDCALSLIWLNDMTCFAVWYDSFNYVTLLCDVNDLAVRHNSFICVTWLIHQFDMTQLAVRYDNSYVKLLDIIYRVAKMHRLPYLYRSFSAKEPCNWWFCCGKRPATYGILCIFATPQLGHDSLVYLAWLIHMWEPWRIGYLDQFKCVTWRLWICDMTHSIFPHIYDRRKPSFW